MIGVCNARDPQDQEGFYAALETICAQLDDARMAFAYQSPKGFEGLSGTAPLMAGTNTPPMAQQMPPPVSPVSIPNALPENSRTITGSCRNACTWVESWRTGRHGRNPSPLERRRGSDLRDPIAAQSASQKRSDNARSGLARVATAIGRRSPISTRPPTDVAGSSPTQTAGPGMVC